MKKKFTDLAAMGMVADLFRVLAETTRLRLLHELQGGERSVKQLFEATQSSQPNVSKHLKILAEAHLIKRRQEGNTVFYFIEDELVFQLCDLVCKGIERRLKKQIQIFRPGKRRAG